MTVLERARVIAIIYHGDLDGIIGASLIARWASERGSRWILYHSTVRGLRRRLREVANQVRSSFFGGAIALVDLAVGSRSDAVLYSQLLRNVKAAWFDHHPWPPGAADQLLRAGIEVYHARDMVSAELVARALGLRDEYSAKLVEVARRDDTCQEGEGLEDKWRVVLRAIDDTSRVVKSFVEGDLWPEWAQRIYEAEAPKYYGVVEDVASRLRVYEFEGVRVALVPMEPSVDVCSVQKALWKRGWNPESVEVEVYVYPRAVSIRSVKLDASCIARLMGGGGHRRAAGAPLRYNYTDAKLARQVAMYARKCMEEAS